MEGFFKLYLLGLLIGAPGISDLKDTQNLKAELAPTAVIERMPLLNNYQSCLFASKKKLANCQKNLNRSIKTHPNSAHKIFIKQRKCEREKEQSYSLCKSIFLK